jgi:hypothetical protein
MSEASGCQDGELYRSCRLRMRPRLAKRPREAEPSMVGQGVGASACAALVVLENAVTPLAAHPSRSDNGTSTRTHGPWT